MPINISATLFVLIALNSTSASAGAIPLCKGAHRAENKLTCIVDGDTGWEQGIKWRLLDIDAPEINHHACENELEKALLSRDRLRGLMADGYTIIDNGKKDWIGRELVRVILRNGRDAGNELLDEGLVQPWPNTGNIWCDE